jgi:hypothetical protein
VQLLCSGVFFSVARSLKQPVWQNSSINKPAIAIPLGNEDILFIIAILLSRCLAKLILAWRSISNFRARPKRNIKL